MIHDREVEPVTEEDSEWTPSRPGDDQDDRRSDFRSWLEDPE